MKKLAALFLLFSVLFSSLPALADDAAQPAFVTQTDGRFAWAPDYLYNNRALISRGSLPCSIANALIAAFGVTDADTAAGVLRETLVFSTSRHTPATSEVDVYCLNQLPRISESEYPLLASLCARYADVRFQGGLVHADYLETLAANVLTESPSLLAMGRVNMSSELRNLAGMCDWLTATGHEDAQVILSMACSGMANASGKPFGMPGTTHYVTLIFNAGEYSADGVFYLMDSLPRGLSVAEQQTLGAYARYAFVDRADAHAALLDAYEIVRQPNLSLRITPRGAPNNADLSLLGMVNYGVVMLCIP